MSARKKLKAKADKHDSEETAKSNDEKNEETSECELSEQESLDSCNSSGEEMFPDGIDGLLDQFSSDDFSSDEDWNPVVTPQKRKKSRLSSISPSPAKSNKSASPSSVDRGKRTHKRKSIRRSLPFSFSISNDQWHGPDEPDIEPPQPPFRPIRKPGPQLVSLASYSPMQFFELFFSVSVMQKIIKHSNAYGAKFNTGKSRGWRNISIKDFKSFLALVIYMGLLKCFQLADYWRKLNVYNLPFPAQIMSCRKFYSISGALHLSDPKKDAENEKKKGTVKYDRLFKIKPLYQDIRDACRNCFQPFQNISIDERMVASKARNGLKQYMKNKPTKWGYKLFVLADSTSGYTWDFFIYEGKLNSKQSKGMSYECVMALADEKLLGSGYKLYVDNFYTSPTLFRDLLSKKIWACGTVRANRIGHSKKAAPRGNIRWFRDDNLLFVEWKDKREVLVCSTFHKAYNGDTVKRKVKGDDGVWTDEDFPVPPAVLDYNKYMGGVDLSDALIVHYTVLHKTRKWYRSFFYHFVDIAVVNAFILHQQMARAKNQKPLTQKMFREALVLELAGIEPSCDSTPIPSSSSGHLHLPKYIGEDRSSERRRCRLCHLKTSVICVTCNVCLCFVPKRECFTTWHKSGDCNEVGTK